MTDNVQAIKERLDFVDILRQYLKLTPAGKNFKALCPFHKEKTPSFMISPDRQVWHCFGCSAGGDIFSFVMKYENIEFFDALKILADKAGIELHHVDTGDQRKLNVLYEINNSAKEFYKASLCLPAKALATAGGAPATKQSPEIATPGQGGDSVGKSYDYVLSRGLKPETIEEFEIGYAPAGGDIILRHLINAGYEIGDIERAGLIFKTDRGSYYDRFRDRLMFPIQNHFGKVVGFTGRILPIGPISPIKPVRSTDNSLAPKYVNSPETSIFHKSKILFGFDKSKNAIRDSQTAVLVEGQMDFLMMWQDGIKNVAASSGTALTIDHLTTLKRISDTLILIFDNDEAGQAATERAIDLAEGNDFLVKVVKLESGKDPADFIKDHPGQLGGIIQKAIPAMEFYFHRYIGPAGPIGPMDRKRALRSVLGKIKNIYSPVERSQWLHELAVKTGVREDALAEEMDRIKIAVREGGVQIDDLAVDSKSRPLSRRELISDRLVALAMNRDWTSRLWPHRDYLTAKYAEAASADFKNLDSRLVMELSLAAPDMTEDKAGEYFQNLLKQLKLEYFKERRSALSLTIAKAERERDEVTLSKTIAEFDLINKEMHNL